jgi:hypothetical protein
MTLLKLKAKIYQYTGLYLARRDESVAMEVEFYKGFYDLTDNEFNESLFIGSWQATNGFCRHSNPLWSKITIHRLHKNKARHAYYSVLGWFVGFYLQLKDDLCQKS